MLTAMLSMSRTDFHDYENELIDCPGPTAKLIWLFYILDVAPELAMDPVHIATWGKVKHKIQKSRMRMTKEEVAAAIAWIQNWPNEPDCDGRKLTSGRIVKKLNCTSGTASRLARLAGYRLANGKKKLYRAKRKPYWISPTGIWMNQNWNYTDKEIAARSKTYWHTVYNVRRKFLVMPKTRLINHIKACGMDISRWKSILDRMPLPKRVKPKHKTITPNFSI